MFLLVLAIGLALSARAAWRRPAKVRGFTPPPPPDDVRSHPISVDE